MATSSPSKRITAIVEIDLEVPKKTTLAHLDELIGGCIYGNHILYMGEKYRHHPYTLKGMKFVIVRPFRKKFKIEERTSTVLKKYETVLRSYKLLGR